MNGENPHLTSASAVCALPEFLAAATAGFAVPAMILLLLGHLSMPVVLPVGLLGAVAMVALCGVGDAPTSRRSAVMTVLAAVVALAWLVLNARWSAQNVYATRDPATYGLTGQWLVHHPSLSIPTQPQVFGDVPGLVTHSAGFGAAGPVHVFAQGNHLLPVLLAVGGWLGGPTMLLKVNVLIGGAALLVFFGLARRIAGDGFGLVAMVTLAVSMPMLAFSRDTYTEPITLFFLVGGLSLLWRAVSLDRPRDYLVAGLVLGSSALARIDSYAALLPIIIVIAVVLAAAPVGRRRATALRCLLLAVGIGVPTVLGYADVTTLSAGYYQDNRSNIVLLGVAGVVLVVVGLLIVAVTWSVPAVRRIVDSGRRTRIALAVGALVVVAFAVLASRPLWTISRGGLSAQQIIVLQKGLGLPVDGSRNYSEHALLWMGWYYGWLTVGLAVIGLALLAVRLIRSGDLPLLGFLGVVLAMSALYFTRAEIYPDQVWAARRYLPIIIPGLLIAAAYVMAVLWRANRWLRPVATGLAVASIAVTAVITSPMQAVRPYPRLEREVQAICGAIGPHGAVIESDPAATSGYAQTMRSYCNVPSAGLAKVTPQLLATARTAAAAHGRTLYVLAQDPASVPFAAGGRTPAPFFDAATQKWPERLVDIPQHLNRFHVTIWLGRVGPSGTVTPLGRVY